MAIDDAEVGVLGVQARRGWQHGLAFCMLLALLPHELRQWAARPVRMIYRCSTLRGRMCSSPRRGRRPRWVGRDGSHGCPCTDRAPAHQPNANRCCCRLTRAIPLNPAAGRRSRGRNRHGRGGQRRWRRRPRRWQGLAEPAAAWHRGGAAAALRLGHGCSVDGAAGHEWSRASSPCCGWSVGCGRTLVVEHPGCGRAHPYPPGLCAGLHLKPRPWSDGAAAARLLQAVRRGAQHPHAQEPHQRRQQRVCAVAVGVSRPSTALG